ncbi:MAG: O-methyltransferase [Sulfurifustaceae bacterium]
MDARVKNVIDKLTQRSRSEQEELIALNALGARFVREAAPRLMLDVGPEVGQLLNMLTRALNAKVIVEVGGSVGYSTIWFAEAAQRTGGRVFSIEPNRDKQREQREHLSAAGLLDYVELVAGDAGEVLRDLPEPFDLVLIDHWKDLYIREFDLAWPRMRRGGLVIADNILRPAATLEAMRAYVQHVRNVAPELSLTVDIGNGIEITTRG